MNSSSAFPAAEKLLQKKKAGEKIVVLTAYDFTSGEVARAAGVDVVLVGDSLGVTVLGHSSTHPVTLNDMEHHARAVARGAAGAFLVGDLPIDTYRTPREAVESSRRLLDAGCHGVKLEGCLPGIPGAVIGAGIPLMGHVGLTPQTFSEYKVQGKEAAAAAKISNEARLLERAGCFAVVLELIPLALAQSITSALAIPTIGIGAGPHCDGQVLVFNDLLGMFDGFKPRFVRRYRELKREMVAGCSEFAADVRAGRYPSSEESYR